MAGRRDRTSAAGRARTLIFAAALLVALLAVQPVRPARASSGAPAPTASALFTFADTRIAESSGLAVSSVDGSIFTHNDSGDTARFFRVDSRGNTVAVYTLRGATNVDWEDMASGTDDDGKPVLYLGDIGDNNSNRKEIEVYQVPEPTGASADVAWVRYEFDYPDGPHDAEALLVDPRDHRIYIATKGLLGGELYEAPAAPSETAVNTLVPLRSVPALVTSGDFSPDGSRIVLLTYLNAYWADGPTGELHAFSVPLQKQDEAIAFTKSGSAVLVGSEGSHSVVYEVPLPPPALNSQPATSSPSPSPPANSVVKRDSLASAAFLAVLVIVTVGLWVLASRWRRRSRRLRVGSPWDRPPDS